MADSPLTIDRFSCSGSGFIGTQMQGRHRDTEDRFSCSGSGFIGTSQTPFTDISRKPLLVFGERVHWNSVTTRPRTGITTASLLIENRVHWNTTFIRRAKTAIHRFS